MGFQLVRILAKPLRRIDIGVAGDAQKNDVLFLIALLDLTHFEVLLQAVCGTGREEEAGHADLALQALPLDFLATPLRQSESSHPIGLAVRRELLIFWIGLCASATLDHAGLTVTKTGN